MYDKIKQLLEDLFEWYIDEYDIDLARSTMSRKYDKFITSYILKLTLKIANSDVRIYYNFKEIRNDDTKSVNFNSRYNVTCNVKHLRQSIEDVLINQVTNVNRAIEEVIKLSR